jgi:phosphatidylglycerophosphate synthase
MSSSRSAEAARPLARFTLDDVRARALKRPDAWWTVLAVDPLATRLLLLVANHTKLTPNSLTAVSVTLGLVSALFFYSGQYAVGAAAYFVGFLLDCVDGKLARLKGVGTRMGPLLDSSGNMLVYAANTFALSFGDAAGTPRLSAILGFTFLALHFYHLWLDVFRKAAAPTRALSESLTSPAGSVARRWVDGLKRRRLTPLPTNPDWEAIVFFIGPLTGMIVPAFGLVILLQLAMLAYTFVAFSLRE